jgi:nucleoid DNA-binding protein
MAATTAKAPTKGAVISSISEKTELSRKQVSAVFEALADEIKGAVGKKGPGLFVVPGLMKIKIKNKPAVKAGMRKDPFTGQERMFPAKPASRRVTVRPLKALKDMVK